MFIAVNQTISEASIRERAPQGFRYDDPWAVAREVAGGLRRQYTAWLKGEYPDAMIEVDKVKEGSACHTGEVKVVVFRFGRNDKDIKEIIQPVLDTIHSAFDMMEIDHSHLIASAS
jgi:hypothetical protein